MTPTNPIEDFYPVFKENRDTSVYFKDENDEAIVVEINSPDFDLLNARYEAFKTRNEESTEEVGEVPVSTEPTTAPVEEKTEGTEVVAPESTETAPTEPTEPVAPISEELNAPENADTQDTAETIGVDMAQDGTESETVNNVVNPDAPVEEEVNEAPQI